MGKVSANIKRAEAEAAEAKKAAELEARRAYVKHRNRVQNIISIGFWAAIVAVYLLWGFLSQSWKTNWVILLISAIIFDVFVVIFPRLWEKKHPYVKPE